MSVRAAVDAHVEAFNARDLEAVVALFAEDAVFAAGDSLVIGRRGLRQLFGDAFDQPARVRLEVRRALVEGDTAACELAEHLALPGGPAVELAVAAFYTVRDGQLVRMRVYRDPS